MRNMKMWKRLLAIGLCSAMVLSMSVGVSATENLDTNETVVTTEEENEEPVKEELVGQEVILEEDSAAKAELNDTLVQIKEDKNVSSENSVVSEEVEDERSLMKEEVQNADEEEVMPLEAPVDIDSLPVVEWNNNYTIVKELQNDDNFDRSEWYGINLGSEWDVIFDTSNYEMYEDGTLLDSGVITAWNDLGYILYFENEPPKDEHEITIKIDKLVHYNAQNMEDGIAKDVTITYKTEPRKVEEGESVEFIPTVLDFDGGQDLVFKFKNGTGNNAIKEITRVAIGCAFPDIDTKYLDTLKFDYDIDAGTITVKNYAINWVLQEWFNSNDKKEVLDAISDEPIIVWMEYTDKNGFIRVDPSLGMYVWGINYAAEKWSANGDKPQLIDASWEFDGTQDMVFNFKNGTGDNAIVSVEEVGFEIKEKNSVGSRYLRRMRFSSDGYNYDIEKGQVSLHKNSVSSLLYGKWNAVNNIYGHCYLVVKLANGTTRTVWADENGDWAFKVLEKSQEADPMHIVDVSEGTEFDAEQMQELVDINKESDVILRVSVGNEVVVFTFAKGTMRMVDGKDSYPWGIEIITDFDKRGIQNTNVTEDIFVSRINFKYNGELPGTAKVSIPVNSKWNGQTLYYYQIMKDGTLKDTGKSAKVVNGTFDVLQTHCSDYVLLAKSPKELGLTEDTGNDNNGNENSNNGNNNNGNGNSNNGNQNSSTGDNTQGSVKNPDSQSGSENVPKTGDNSMILLFIMLFAVSSVVVAGTLRVKSRVR